MKDKFGLTKIENPYKVFLRNIQIGIFIILFIFGSIFTGTAIFNKNNSDEVLADNAYKCTFTLNKNGGSGGTNTIYIKNDFLFIAGGYWLDSACSSTRMYNNSNAITKPERTGYDFAGYYTARTGGDIRITADGYLDSNVPSTTEYTSSGTWYAHWTPKTYTITFYINCDSMTRSVLNGQGLLWWGTQQYTYSTSTQILSFSFNNHAGITETKALGYVIDTWEASTSNGVKISSSGERGAITISGGKTGDFSVKANFKETTYSINYDYASGTAGNSNPSSAKYYDNLYISNPTKTGYYFAGWKVQNVTSGAQYMSAAGSSGAAYKDISEGSIVRASETVSGNGTYFSKLNVNNGGTVKLTANWTAQYTIEFSGVDKSSQLCKVGDSISLGEPTKTGYTFIGWTSSAKDGLQTSAGILTGNVWSSWDGSSYNNSGKNFVRDLRSTPGTVTVTANFEPITYTVKIDRFGDGSWIATQTVLYDEIFNVYTSSKNEIEFKGWQFTSSNLGKYSSNALSGSDENNLTKLSYNSLSNPNDNYTYFKNLTTQAEIVYLTAKWTPTIHYYVVEDKYSYDSKGALTGTEYGWKVNISINNYYKTEFKNYVDTSYDEKDVLGVFTSNQFTKDSILGVVETGKFYLDSYVKDYSDFYVLLDNTTTGDWSTTNKNKYTIKVEFDDVAFLYDDERYSSEDALSLSHISYSFSIGERCDFSNSYWINCKGNDFLSGLNKKISVGRDYLDASNIYFFMDVDKNLWAWDGTFTENEKPNSVKVGITLDTLCDKGNIEKGTSFNATLVAELESLNFEVKDKTDLLNIAQIFNLGGLDGFGSNYTITLTGDIENNDIPADTDLPTDFEKWWDNKDVKLGVITEDYEKYYGGSYMSNTGISFCNYIFKGTFNGNGHTITNLNHTLIGRTDKATIKNIKISKITPNTIRMTNRATETYDWNGLLVQYAFETIVEDITVKEVNGEYNRITNYGNWGNLGLGKSNNFGLVGYANNSKVTKCNINEFSATFIKASSKWSYYWYDDDGYNVGGIVGELEGGSITDCSVKKFHFTGGGVYTSIGGIVGKVVGSGVVEDCVVGGYQSLDRTDNIFVSTNSGEYRRNFVGGIAGKLDGDGAQIENCQNVGETMSISVVDDGDHSEEEGYGLNIGGIVGGVIKGNISNCGNLAYIAYNASYKNQFAIVGGIVGLADLDGKELILGKCYNLGVLTISNGGKVNSHRIGGLIGAIYQKYNSSKKNITIEYCYSVSSVTCTGGGGITCGQFVGRKEDSGTLVVRNSYYSIIPGITYYDTTERLNDADLVGAFSDDGNLKTTTNVYCVYSEGNENVVPAGNRVSAKSFTKGINNKAGEIAFAFNKYVQYGLPVLKDVGNTTITYKLYNVNLSSNEDVYYSSTDNAYIGFGIYDVKYVKNYYVQNNSAGFVLPKATSSEAGKTFIGYGEGSSATTVCSSPDLSKSAFSNGSITITKEYFKNEKVVSLTAVFAECATIISNLNLINGSVDEPSAGSKLEYKNEIGYIFTLEYTGEENGKYKYEFMNTVSEENLTRADFYNILNENGVIENLGKIKLNLSQLTTENVFNSFFNFSEEHTGIDSNGSGNISAGGYYCYGYTNPLTLNVIQAKLDENKALKEWEYGKSAVSGRLVYGITTKFDDFETNLDKDTAGLVGEYGITRKGFVLRVKDSWTNLFGARNSNSEKGSYTLNTTDIGNMKEGGEFQVYEVYSRDPYLEINYYDVDGEFLYSEMLPATKVDETKKDSGIEEIIATNMAALKLEDNRYVKLESSTYIKQDNDPNFAGWWADTTLSDSKTKDRNLRVYEGTVIWFTGTQKTINLYKKVVKSDLSVTKLETVNNYYEIYYPEDLVYVSYLVNKGSNDTKIKLMNDIDLAGYNFVPFSYKAIETFTGEFDGNGYSIKNLTISGNALLSSLKNGTCTANETSGLFGYSNGTIKNLNILDASISHLGSCKSYIGLVAGINTGTIANVVAKGTITKLGSGSSTLYVGGIAGQNNGTISECVSDLSITNEDSGNLGAIAGNNSNSGTISDCFARNYNVKRLVGTGSSCTNSYIKNGNTKTAVVGTFNDSSKWKTTNYINNGLPYLVNTGISKITFQKIEPATIFNGTNNVLGTDERNTTSSEIRDFFILDDYSTAYNDVLKGLFANNGYSGYNFAGYSYTNDPVTYPALTTTTKNYNDKESGINVFEKTATYYTVWEAEKYEITIKDTDLSYSVNFGKTADFNEIFKDVCSEFKTQMSANYQDIDYFEFTYKGKKFYVDRYGVFVNVENEKITGKTTHNEVTSFFPYMYDENIELTAHFFNIDYKIYVDANGGEWRNLPSSITTDEDSRISVSGKGSDIVLFGGLSISNNATEGKLTDLNENGIESEYFYKKGYHVAGFAYFKDADLTDLVDIYKFSDIDATYMQIEGEIENPQDVYNSHYVVVYAIYEPNVYTVTYVAKNSVETETFNETFNTTLKQQDFTYGESAEIFEGEEINVTGYNFVRYEFTYKGIKYYLNQKARFTDENGTLITVNIENTTCSTFTPYYFTENLTVDCILERKDIIIEFTGLYGVSAYYEIYDKFSLESVKSFGKIYGNDEIEVKYGDSLKVWYFVEHATKLNSILLNNSSIFSGQSKINSLESFASEYNEQTVKITNINSDQNLKFETESLKINAEDKYSTENLLEKENDVYLIYDAQDLYTFFEKYYSDKARLQNNINLAGYTFSVKEFSGELDGNYFTISGFVIANSQAQNLGFIQNLTGKIYNLNFDNVILNINSLAFNLNNIYEVEIDNSLINIAIVATQNNGTIDNVYVLGGKFKVLVESDSTNTVNIGLISVINNQTISSSCAEATVNIENSGATLAFAGISVYNKNKIEKSYFDGEVNCNTGTIKGVCVENTGTLSASYAYYNSIEEIIRNDNDDNNALFVTVEGVERLINVNNTIITLTHNYEATTNLNGILTYVNGKQTQNGETYLYLYKLNNGVNFNTTNNTTTNQCNFNLVIKKSGSDVSKNFVTVNNTTNEEIEKKIVYQIKNYPENLSYDLMSTPNAWENLDVKFFIDEASKFSDEHIAEILQSATLKVTINGETKDDILLAEYYDKYDSEGNKYNYFDNVESIFYYALSMNYITLKFNDEVKFELNLPSFARLGTKLGVKINGNEKINYRGERNFDYEFVVENQTEKFWFYVERNTITFKINLNKDNLLESEKEYIKFNSEFYSNANYVYNEAEQSVTITIYPTLQDDEYIYIAPDISNMIDYDKLGKHYSFEGLFEKDNNGLLTKIVYDENYSCLINSPDKDYDVYIKWEAVEYSIMMIYDETVRYSSYNGFSQTNGYMTKVVKFGDKLTDDEGISVEVPYAIKLLYNFAYKLDGLNIVENGDVVYALTMNENGLPILFDNYFSRVWTAYENGTMNGLPKVRLEPVFSEIEFNVELRTEGTIFTTNGQVDTTGGTFEDGTQSAVIKMTLSKYLEMRETNFSSIKVPSFEHFEFKGYYAISPSSLVLNYSKTNNCYNEKECETLLSDVILLSAYNSTFVDVTIHAVDAYSLDKTPFDLIVLNDIVDYVFTDEGLTFDVEYNSTDINLPEIKIQSTDYRFVNYIVNGENYSNEFIFVANTDIYLACEYKITLKTFGAKVSSDEFTEEVEAQTYTTYKSSPIIASSQITLPELSLENYILQGYKINGKIKADNSLYLKNEIIDVIEPMVIEAVWSGKIVEVTLDGNGGKLPSTIQNFTGFMGYTLIDETHAKLDVVHSTLGSVVSDALPVLKCEGKTFDKYIVEEQNLDLINYTFNYESNPTITVKAEYLNNDYTIKILEADSVVETITAQFGEEIISNFIPSLQDVTYCGLSLNKDYLINFEMPSSMTYLESEYSDYVEISNNKITLTVYAFYLSNSIVQIEANTNAKITNTTNLNEFTGGNSFGNPASFKLTVENITTLNFRLPIPEVQNELEFAIFKGYYGYNENNEFVEMVDASGNLTNNFKVKDNLVLTMMFEQKGYDLTLTGDYSNVVSAGDFEQNGSEFTKHVEFGENVGTLPVLELENYKFKGFYFSKSTDNTVNATDVQLSDENGVLLSDYESFSMAYINKLNEEGMQIIAKYEQSFVTINIKSNNSVLGVVTVPRNEQGVALTYTEIENGYSCVVASGTSIMITALVEKGAKFTEWTQDKSLDLENPDKKETIVLNITEEATITANFEYVEYKIHYYLGTEELTDITPSSFHMDENVVLPSVEIEGYDFLGWFEEKSLITEISSISTNTYNDVTVYAKVNNKQLTVNVYSSLDNYTEKTTFDVYYNLKLDALKNFNSNQVGYSLVGLFTEKDGKGYAINENSLCVFPDSFNLYALFTEEVVNTLKGSGTQINPYKISTEEDLINFANLINSNICNSSTVYFELTNNLEVNLSNLKTIGNGVRAAFNANFNGNENVIYVKGENFNSNFALNENGKIESYNGLFGINNGNISNVIIVSDIILNKDYSENYTQFVGNICAVNNNVITNCIVYTQVDNQTTGVQLGAVSAINNKIEELNTVIVVENGETIYLSQLEKHYHKNNITKPKISNNAYYIYSETDLAWLTAQNKIDYDVYLMNNLDMKGKILSSIKLNKNFYGNGYTISNILVLDNSSLINSIGQDNKLEKVNFENAVLFNFTSSISTINENNGTIEKVLISGMTNSSLLVTTNNGSILNCYSLSNNNCYNVVNVNNQLIENSYSYNNNFVKDNNGGTLNNVYNMTLENYSEIITQIEQNYDINSQTSIWIIDENCVMFEQKLPVLKGVGNVYLLITADEEFVATGSTPYNPINNILLLKTASDIKIGFELTESYLHINSLTLNGTNIMQNKIGQNIYINASNLLVENELVVKLAKNIITIDISVENASYGDIKYGDNLYKEISVEVEYGTIISFEAMALNGYRFGSWSDEVTTSDREIFATQNLTFIAHFNKVYDIEVYYNLTGVNCVDKHANFNETEYGLKGTFDTTEFAKFEDLYPILTKENYVLNGFEVIKMADNKTIKLNANWKIDYIKVEITTIADNFDTSIVSSESVVEQINVIEKISKTEYNILKNKDATLTLTLNTSYLTKILINGIDIYSSTDYETLKVLETINIDLTSYTSNDISIEFEVQNIEFNTYFSNIDYAIKFIKSYEIIKDEENENENLRNYITTVKNEEISFQLSFDDYTTLNSIKLLSLSGEVLETELKIQDKFGEIYYSFIPTEHTIILVETKTKEYIIKVNYTEGGKIFSDIESEVVSDNLVEFKIGYNENFVLYIEIDTGYKLTSVTKTLRNSTSALTLSNSYSFNNVSSDIEISITFKKQSTWLSVDAENNPVNFKLTGFKGQGTTEKPYLISNIKDFLTLGYNVNILNESYSGKIFKVSNKDLVFDFTQYYFMPIGTNETVFDGTILGNNLTLKGIKIENGTNVGVFSGLGTNGVLKSIVVAGTVKAHNLVAGLVGTNNGTILGCSSKVSITGINDRANENNVVAGICAINNGTISQTSFSGSIGGVANILAGLCGINNGEIINVYNSSKVELSKFNNATEVIVSGLIGNNNGSVSYAYNSATVKTLITNEAIKIYGVAKVGGTIENVYYNSNVLTPEDVSFGKTSSELKDEGNEIYELWDFENIWYFDEQTYDFPKLRTLYEFSGTINFKVSFDKTISTKVLFITLTNAYGESYDIVLNSTKPTASITNLSEGSYTITLKTAYSVSVNSETTATVELSEEKGTEYPVEIALTKTNDSGYCSSILI